MKNEKLVGGNFGTSGKEELSWSCVSQYPTNLQSRDKGRLFLNFLPLSLDLYVEWSSWKTNWGLTLGSGALMHVPREDCLDGINLGFLAFLPTNCLLCIFFLHWKSLNISTLRVWSSGWYVLIVVHILIQHKCVAKIKIIHDSTICMCNQPYIYTTFFSSS